MREASVDEERAPAGRPVARALGTPGFAAGPQGAALALQRTAGNRAVVGLLRQVADQPVEAGDAPLRSCLLSNSSELQAAAQNNPTLKQGKHGVDVASMQYALRKLGYPLDNSFPDGLPDGKYGPDTAENVRQFQIDEHIDPPGGFEAGRRTLHHLDDRIVEGKLDECEVPPKPDPKPDPKPPPGPSFNITCPDPARAKAIRAGLVAGQDALSKAQAKFFSDKQAARDAAFLFFRSRSVEILTQASQNMQKAAVALPRQEYRCMENGEGACEPAAGAFSLNFNPVIVMCPLFFAEKTNRARIVVHENMHMAGLQRPGLTIDPEHSLDSDDPFLEIDPTLSVDERIRDADHNAGFVLALAFKSSAELAAAAAHRGGGDLSVGVNNKTGFIPTTGPVPKLIIKGNDDRQVGISGNQVWKVTNDRGAPVAVTPLPDLNEAVLSRAERDRLVMGGEQVIEVKVELEVTGTGQKTITGSIPIGGN